MSLECLGVAGTIIFDVFEQGTADFSAALFQPAVPVYGVLACSPRSLIFSRPCQHALESTHPLGTATAYLVLESPFFLSGNSTSEIVNDLYALSLFRRRVVLQVKIKISAATDFVRLGCFHLVA